MASSRRPSHEAMQARPYSSSCSIRLYFPLPLAASPSPFPLFTMLLIHPPSPSERSPLVSVLSFGRPSSTSTVGGSILRPGIALSAVCVWPWRRSRLATGDRAPLKRDSTSACVCGVGMTEVASPKIEFMSSNRTFAVSG